ncbi:hypothetical protein ACJDT4_23155 [Clostridium neuense]|uniref:Uncharacterized protein n=1 Tax=Clostridium neuense TaxID=1728934 RepID=A0ABW8TL45_9CLOT
MKVNIKALIEVEYIKYKNDLSEKELEELKRVIEQAKCENYCNCK